MSSNNYYGFTHAGTQYGTTYTPVSAVASTGYAMSAQMYSPRYEQTYQQTAANSYAYNRSQQNASAVGYVATDSSQYQSAAANNAYPYTSSGVTSYTNSYNSVVTNYAATALYSQQSNASATEGPSSAAIYSSNNKNTNWNFKKTMKGNTKPKTANKAQQLHYCEVCKISCAGPQTYKEHLEGQRHKKKEAQQKSGSAQTNTKRHGPGIGGISLRCELCDVTCTGNDAYAAHIRGVKHQKVVKLHTKLGKPIPSTDPVVVSPNVSMSTAAKIQSATAAVTQSANTASKIKVLGTPRINFIGGGRLHTTNLNEIKEENYGESVANNNSNNNNNNSNSNNCQQQQQQTPQQQTTIAGMCESSVGSQLTTTVTDVDKSLEAQPVGQNYIDEIRAEEGKALSFHCKLCDCRFNDPNAKEMHLKGRRHRLQYKKKVDPDLIVDVKPSLKHRKMGDFKDRRYNYKRDAHYWNDWYPNTVGGGRYNDYRHIPPPHLAIPPPPPPPPHMMTPPPPPPGFGSGFMGSPAMVSHYRRSGSHTGSWDDSHIMQKHAEICPKEEELDEIHHLVSCVERALKLVSDKIAEQDSTNAMNDIIKRELGDTDETTVNVNVNVESDGRQVMSNAAQNEVESRSCGDDPQHQFRHMKGLMRIGALAKGLLLTGEREVDLVVICAQKPNKDLLQRIVDYLPSQLQSVSASESFDIVMKPHEAGLSINTTSEPKVTANVTLTSPLVREESNACDTTATTAAAVATTTIGMILVNE